MRALDSAATALLQNRDRKTYLRCTSGGTDLADWLQSARWGESLDGGAGEATVTLLAKSEDVHVAPVITSTLALGQTLKLEVALLDSPGTPASADWIEVFDGEVSDIDWPDTTVTVRARQRRIAKLASLWVEADTQYGTDAGRQLHLVMRDILADWGGGVTLVVDGTAPGFTVVTYVQEREPVLRALERLAGLAGWTLEQRWDASEGEFALTMLAPGRANTTADWTLGRDDYMRLPRVRTSLDRVRNVVEVTWVDSSGVTVTTEVTDAASVTAVGRRWMEIEAGAQVDTTTEAQDLANAILSDLATPEVDASIETRLFWPLELGDLWQIPADGRHWSAAQTLAVQGYQHVWDGGDIDRSVVRLSGKPSYGRAKWLAQGIAEVQQPPSISYANVDREVL